jgi:transcriptional regulator GlxA family with amidase domain
VLKAIETEHSEKFLPTYNIAKAVMLSRDTLSEIFATKINVTKRA